jgi:hypothetical protein
MTATTKLDREWLRQVLGKQHDVISRGQALDCGMTDTALRYRTRADGPWQTLLRGVYVAQTGPPTVDQLDMAAQLYAGPDSVITGLAALRRLRLRRLGPRTPELRTLETGQVDVLVPAARQRRTSGFARILRTTRMPERWCIDGELRFTLAARGVADAARGMTELREVRALVADSVQQEWCTLTELTGELNAGPAAGSARLRQVLGEVATGARPAVEAEFQDLVKRAGLPAPMFSARLFADGEPLGRAGAWWPEAGVAAEVDSREWHLSPEDWERTMSRHARMTAAGILVLHFSPKQVRTEQDEVTAALRKALETGEAGGRPQIRAQAAS